MSIRPLIRFISLVISGVALSLLPQIDWALGCPASPDVWFHFSISIDSKNFPKGITARPSADNPADAGIYFYNATNIPFRVFTSHPGQSAQPYVRILSSGAVVQSDEVYTAVSRGQIAKDNRPLDVKVPAPEHFTFEAMYGDDVVKVSGVVYFFVNQNYNPKKLEQMLKECGPGTNFHHR